MEANDHWGILRQNNNKKTESTPANLGGGGSSGKLSKKMEKSKVVASKGIKKVKNGATVSVNWIKLKCHTNKLNQNDNTNKK